MSADRPQRCCWRCKLRLNNIPPDKSNYLFGDLNENENDRRSAINNECRVADRTCDLCKDLLLIDSYSIFRIEQVPNEVIKVKRSGRKKTTVACGRHVNNTFTFNVYKANNEDVDSKSDSGIRLRSILDLVLNEAVRGDKMCRIVNFGVSIELSSDLKESSGERTNASVGLKDCLRQLLVNQTENVVLNQNSDLLIGFSFKTSNDASFGNVGFAFRFSVNFKWKSVYLSGRYVKLSRRISQSRWSHGDSDLVVDTSIEELLESSLVKMLRFSNLKFSSSGREDIDVRMLGIAESSFEDNDNPKGRGRPFAIEINGVLEHHHLFYSNIELDFSSGANSSLRYRSVDEFIQEYTSNIKTLSDCRVVVNSLRIVDVNTVNEMNRHVDEKEKCYVCVCYSPIPLLRDDYYMLSKELENCSIFITQRTPIRVLHRRVNMDRKKNISKMKIVELNEHYFMLYLKTQSGTYIKEFIHGDFGRTRPSFGDLITIHLPEKRISHKLEISIVQLDVLNVI